MNKAGYRLLICQLINKDKIIKLTFYLMNEEKFCYMSVQSKKKINKKSRYGSVRTVARCKFLFTFGVILLL